MRFKNRRGLACFLIAIMIFAQFNTVVFAYEIVDNTKVNVESVNKSPIVKGHEDVLVVKHGTEVTKDMILGGIEIVCESEYTIEVKKPNIEEDGQYEAEIIINDIEGRKASVVRKIIITSSSIIELPESGQGLSEEDVKVLQVVDEEMITSLSHRLSEISKDYVIKESKISFSEYNKYNFVIYKKQAVFKEREKTYVEIRVSKVIEAATGGIIIDKYKEILATSVTINNKEKLKHYIDKGEEINISATIIPDNTTNKELDWISTNNDVIEIERVEQGIKIVAKEYGVATIKVGAVDGSDQYDEFTFSVTNSTDEVPSGIEVICGNGTEDSPIIYATKNIDSLKALIGRATEEFNVLLQDKVILKENLVQYSIKLREKSNFKNVFTKSKEYYIAVQVPKNHEFNEFLYMLEREDLKSPVFNYNGDMEIILEFGQAFNNPIITALDNLDDEVEVKVTTKKSETNEVISEIDTTIPGNYNIVYEAEDSSGNKASLVIKVKVNAKLEVPEEDKDENIIPEVTPEEDENVNVDTEGNISSGNKTEHEELENSKEEDGASDKEKDINLIVLLGTMSLAIGTIFAFKMEK
ncbi:hypothetical protein SAMN02745196_02680 [Clostridium collagenovorans DSM 3089]|uniref:Pesticidal crystal protein Cry22Aa Ig-like domain-containing protein n=1 Tax=Clostridium collagenovorans DSM 3089 TaxID=1121306 RepID=A0A1M5Y5L8_9CLOT|nr:immunoglobulin-like domain-containing protein [Clostridium collagenovorans]SHI07276.1 hypothetical protein SAMN02745196_02680 [Clostridium collagenovorans DSM 3089]